MYILETISPHISILELTGCHRIDSLLGPLREDGWMEDCGVESIGCRYINRVLS